MAPFSLFHTLPSSRFQHKRNTSLPTSHFQHDIYDNMAGPMSVKRKAYEVFEQQAEKSKVSRLPRQNM